MTAERRALFGEGGGWSIACIATFSKRGNVAAQLNSKQGEEISMDNVKENRKHSLGLFRGDQQ